MTLPVFSALHHWLGRLVGLLLLLSIIAAGAACQPIENYTDPAATPVSRDYASSGEPAKTPAQLKVIAWNIRFAENVDTAIEELNRVADLQNPDILLLQEMNRSGTEALAHALQLNYIYYPASVHTHHNDDFGNAVLSPWSLSEPVKLILPHTNPKNQQQRIAVRATVQIGELTVLAYSAHTETIWMSLKERQEQWQAITANIPPQADYVIVGGDFNTTTTFHLGHLNQIFEQAKMSRVSEGSGPTFSRQGLTFYLDHIYARSFTAIEADVWPDTQASDHFPLWVTLTIPPSNP